MVSREWRKKKRKERERHSKSVRCFVVALFMMCQLEYFLVYFLLLSLFFVEEKIDVNNIDLWTLPVKKLKKILTGWGEHCKGCLEKSDLIAKINQVKDSHLEL